MMNFPTSDRREFLIKFVTQDGNVVMNRPSSRACFFHPDYETIREGIAQDILKLDAMQHRVRIISHQIDILGVTATVEPF